MCNTQCVLALLALYLGSTHSFSWDIVLARDKGLEFLNDGVLTYSAFPSPTRYITWITYDPIHNRVLFSNRFNTHIFTYSFDIATKKTHTYRKNTPDSYLKTLAYDPGTELLFGSRRNSIYSFSLKPGSNNEVNGDLVINLEKDKTWFRDIAVDSCGRYIYWITDRYRIERARFNGTKREIILDSDNLIIRQCLTIDSQKIYWIESREEIDYEFTIQSADLDGNNKRTLYIEKEYLVPEILTVSKDFIYWGDSVETFFWKLPKKSVFQTDLKPKRISIPWGIQDIAVNYNVEEETQYVEELKINQDSLDVDTDASPLCLHGTIVSGKSVCECAQGYTGERCEVSVCHNYCFRGDCSVSAEGQPKCRCNSGYTGERCENNACYKYCLNNGACSINENCEPACLCTRDYGGERCDVPIFLNKCVQTVTLLKEILKADVTPVTLGEVKSACVSNVL